MGEVLVPQLNANDVHTTLVEWCVSDGAEVKEGEVIAVLETSKASEDLVAAESGFLLQTQPAGAEIEPGKPIGVVCPDRSSYETLSTRQQSSLAGHPAASDLVLTDAARDLVERHGISEAQLRTLGRRTIRAADLQPLLSTHVDEEELPVDSQQATVAEVVSLAHREIPDASLVMKVGADALLSTLRRFEEAEEVAVGLPAVAVAAVAALRARFPRAFARWDGGRAMVIPGAHVAVTTDAGRGLYLPVVRHADRLGAVAIAQKLMGFHLKALRRAFELANLTGANIALTLHTDTGIVAAVPVIPPGLAAAVSLCAIQDEVVLDEDASVRRRSYLHVAMTYDHRLNNGREAMDFLTALRGLLESAPAVEALLTDHGGASAPCP